MEKNYQINLPNEFGLRAHLVDQEHQLANKKIKVKMTSTFFTIMTIGFIYKLLNMQLRLGLKALGVKPAFINGLKSDKQLAISVRQLLEIIK